MKRTLFAILTIFIGMIYAHSQTGVWTGDLEVQGVKIPLVFHLDKDNPTVDSPAQGAKGIPMQFSNPSSDSISINIPAIGASFVGNYQNNQIIGIFSQRGLSLPLTLIPGEKTAIRPQTPHPPFPYSQQEVSFSNGDALLKGTLTLPEGYNRDTPVVIMITGSGLHNRDEEIFEHKPFAVIADQLARRGIASLRYDDRGFGESTGDAANCTTDDLKNDALAGINLLRRQFHNVGVLGHSEGGTIALMLGVEKKVDFIISLAGMTISGKETLLDQNKYALSQAGFPTAIIDEYSLLLSSAFDGDDAIRLKLDKSDLPNELKLNLQTGLRQLDSPYMKYFLTLDISCKLGNIACPVLALNGTKDTQVFHEKNLDALQKGLPANPHNQIMALDSLNHLFQHCQTGSALEYSSIEETISPEVLSIISDWITSL